MLITENPDITIGVDRGTSEGQSRVPQRVAGMGLHLKQCCRNTEDFFSVQLDWSLNATGLTFEPSGVVCAVLKVNDSSSTIDINKLPRMNGQTAFNESEEVNSTGEFISISSESSFSSVGGRMQTNGTYMHICEAYSDTMYSVNFTVAQFVETVGQINLLSNSPRHLDEVVEFLLIAPIPGTNTTFTAEVEPGIMLVLPTPTQVEYSEMMNLLGVNWYESEQMAYPSIIGTLFNHTYTRPVVYNVSVTAEDSVVRLSVLTSVAVQPPPCTLEFTMSGGGASAEQAVSYQGGQNIRIQGTVTRPCPYTLKTTFLWSLYRHNGEGQAELVHNTSDTGATLFIAKRTLAYGQYTVSLNVSGIMIIS